MIRYRIIDAGWTGHGYFVSFSEAGTCAWMQSIVFKTALEALEFIGKLA